MSEAINAILAEYWDPLSTVAQGGFADEYDSYSHEIEKMLNRRDGIANITSYLCDTEENCMLLFPDLRRAKHVARLLIEQHRYSVLD